jgi:hypothetical protein
MGCFFTSFTAYLLTLDIFFKRNSVKHLDICCKYSTFAPAIRERLACRGGSSTFFTKKSQVRVRVRIKGIIFAVRSSGGVLEEGLNPILSFSVAGGLQERVL